MTLDLAQLRAALSGCVFGREIKSYTAISSTQDYAILVAETDPCSHGTVIVSDSQLFGRGRRGKKWLSPLGGLWFSVIAKQDMKASSGIFLSYAMSLAVCETIVRNFHIEGYIKWPNDILIKTKKVAGILISSAVRGMDLEYCVVGAGINLNSRPKGLKGSTSLIDHTKQSSIKLEPFLASVLILFNHYYSEIKAEKWGLVMSRWKFRCPMMGKKVKVLLNGVQLDGLASNIDPNGSLILITTGGEKLIISDTQNISIENQFVKR
ncbi:MAG: biotin--[acetyl-CoA-carboxylase] ligase [Nitrososphaeraceae archaeon]